MRSFNRFFPPIIAVFLLLLGMVAGINLVQKPQELREQAAPSTAVSILPGTQSKAPNDPVSFSVTLNTGSNQVIGMDLVVSYDPSVLEVVSISKGSDLAAFTTVVQNSIDNASGTVTYSLFTVDKTKAVSGANVDALDINAKVKSSASAGTHTISFGQATSVAALTEGQNVVVSKVPGTLIVTSETVTATPATNTPTPGSSGSGSSNSGGNTGSSGGNSSPGLALGKRGDLNNDGKITVLDLSILLSRFLKGGGSSDLNGDGKTNISDLSILLSNWGK